MSDDGDDLNLEDIDPEEVDSPWVGDPGEAERNFAVGLFVLTVVAAFVPVVTPLPLGYVLAVIVWLLGALTLYLFGYRRVQDGYDEELATARRAVAGLAAAYLVFQVLETSVRILTSQQAGSLVEYRPYLIAVAVLVAIFAALLAKPERLVWFVAGIFVGHFLVVQGLRILSVQPVVTDPVLGVLAYLGILGVPTVLAYVLVYRDGARRLREGVS